VASHLQDGSPKLVTVDRLHQMHLEARRPHARAPRPGRNQGDRGHSPPEADVNALVSS